ncbi:hypothetical protein Aple_020730 [Acrocarpospora pleiomorpha]|uniref:SnoaL-like domain-containing protein n=2 Tax=Acrocarpospora pleiomorpha TaxID=90975 RepID=A0A5M3XBW9_9ACTN|nr:hypothetical protein [Acrocarpospora pleiomorpha]GES19177.1 hypothetical protein Aple_020730 [Acrocarpospora pleiomorpha]
MFASPFGEMYRNLAAFARRRIRRPRQATPQEHHRVVTAFWSACETGDVNALISLLDPYAITLSDGGGKVRTALHPIRGADRTAHFMLGALSHQPALEATLRSVNGKTGLVLRHASVVSAVVSFQVRNEKITHVWVVLNPDKLRSWHHS